MEQTENIEPVEPADESAPEEIAEFEEGNGVHSFAAKAEEKVRLLRDTAKAEAGQRVHVLGEKAQQRIENERDRVATRIEDAASRLRQRGDTGGPIGHAAGERVAAGMEAAAGYLHERHSDEIAGDIASYVKQHPIQSIIAAALAGYLLGRMT